MAPKADEMPDVIYLAPNSNLWFSGPTAPVTIKYTRQQERADGGERCKCSKAGPCAYHLQNPRELPATVPAPETDAALEIVDRYLLMSSGRIGVSDADLRTIRTALSKPPASEA